MPGRSSTTSSPSHDRPALPSPCCASGLASCRRLPPLLHRLRLAGTGPKLLEERRTVVRGGSRVGKTAHVAISVDHGGPDAYASVVLYITGEREALWQANGLTTIAEDATAIRQLLADKGLSWHHVSDWFGDSRRRASMYEITKGNEQLRHHLAYQYGVQWRSFPRIRVLRRPQFQ